ncbi:MAG: TetR/AcrR family transcriptional regulator [Desulfovermiculus sp.]|nr:TetR/AcrR family transcriptional regulator [Desulfovermiculus sp.]
MHIDQVNERILEAAEAEFARHGYHEAVVSDIAARAQVGKGTVYRRFGDKQSLFASLVRRGLAELQNGVEAVVDRESEPKQALLAVLDVYFDFFDQARDLIAITILEGVKITSGIHDELRQEVKKVLALFGRIFANGMQEGFFKTGDPHKMAFLLHEFIWSVLRGAIFFGYNPRQEYGPDMAEIFLYGTTNPNVK